MKLILLPLLFAALGLAGIAAGPATTLDLAGEWRLQLDARDEGIAAAQWQQPFADTIALPGTTALAGKGNALDLPLNLQRPAMQSLHQRFRFVGPAWYQRTVRIPADWADRDVTLVMERVIWETRVWVNGVEAGAPQRSLTTPHRHDLTRLLKPGVENVLTVRIDNREKLPIGILGHSYTDETQSIWNGVVGRFALEATPRLRLDHLRLRPDLARGGVAVTASFINHTGRAHTAPLTLRASLSGSDASTAPLAREVTIAPGASTQEFFLPLPAGAARWSEFTPVKHAVTATLGEGGAASTLTDSFGLREFKADGRLLVINGQPTFLRGTVECAQFPQTGHPDVVGAQWEKIFTTARAYGLNHLRFHSWCPPKVAFEVADRLGFYLQVELPNWTFKMGQNAALDDWFDEEAHRIFREYGNHPSFVMFSLGNELLGDFAKMDAFVVRLRQLEPKLLFTSTSFAFAPRGKTAGPEDDFFVSQETASGWVRGQGFINQTPPTTDSDYAPGLSSVPVPLVTHEVGQYVVYPNLAELPKYDSTPMRATAWEAIAADLRAKGRLDEADDYTRASGKLAVLLYKEDLERALRTKDLAGIQLLQLQDFPGQSTATVGLLDAFWDSKGLVTPEEFREFCSPTVPLVRMPKMVYEDGEKFSAMVELAHFGAAPLKDAGVTWKLSDGDRVVGEGKFAAAEIPLGNGIAVGRIAHAFGAVTEARRLTLSVEVGGTAARNRWHVWVYPAAPAATAPAGVRVVEKPGPELYAALRAGESVVLLPPRAHLREPLDGRFIPVFWSPLHFPNQPGTLGALIDATHPVWRGFPTGGETDWQWWELLSQSYAFNLDSLAAPLAMPFRFVDKYNRNAVPAAIFEARVGPGRLLVCTLDIATDLEKRLVARQLRRSLFAYAGSTDFAPTGQLSEVDLQALLVEQPLVFTASSAEENQNAFLAGDGNPDTFWFSAAAPRAKLPAQLSVDLGREQLLSGFHFTPRQDRPRGRVAAYRIEVSLDGREWRAWGEAGKFPDDKKPVTVAFAQPVRTRHVRLVATAVHGGGQQAAVGELSPTAREITHDVRDLGIVPGFNDKK